MGALTSQGGGDEDVVAILLDDGVDELLRGGPASQEADAALELGHQGHGVPDQVPPLDGRVPHLPTCKFPGGRANRRGQRSNVRANGRDQGSNVRANLVTSLAQ